MTPDEWWTRVDRTGGPDACWPWTLSLTTWGYGQTYWCGRVRDAHRVAWLLTTGAEPPDGLCVLHTCDNPPCCNPRHLFVGTKADNTADMVAKGRHRPAPSGPGHGSAKFTSRQVRAIRDRHAAGVGVRAIARDVGVNHAQISRIVRRISYREVA